MASWPELDIRLVLEPLTTIKISLHDEFGQKKDIDDYINSVVRSDIHAINSGGETPYQASLRRGFREIADLLWKNGAGRLGEGCDEILL